MIFFGVCIIILGAGVFVVCEPPVNSYGPPQPGQNRPSQVYGPPGFQPGKPINTNNNNQPPGPAYGPPPQNSFGNNGRHPDSDQRPGSSYLPPNQQPNSKYGPPNNRNDGQDQQVPLPGPTYGPPFSNGPGPRGSNTNQQAPNKNNRPSSNYGPPDKGGRNFGAGYPASNQQDQNGYSGGRSGNDDSNDANTEPAKYQFEYEVNDQQFGTQFGHQESRDGDKAVGEYNVVLPDGRKQIVRYEADSEGFRPQISYEGEASNGNGDGYPKQDNGYPRGGPSNSAGPPFGDHNSSGQHEGYPAARNQGPANGGNYENNALSGSGPY